MKAFIVAALFFLLGLPMANAQIDSFNLEVMRAHEDTLEVLADGIMSEKEEARLIYCEKFIKYLVQALKEPNSYKYPFEYFENISIQVSPDDQFRIITWQLEVERGEYRYYGAIQMNSDELVLHPLIDRSFELEQLYTEVTDNNRWYGSVYYKIIPFQKSDQYHYLLFGYDMNDFLNRRKIIDVLTFDESRKPVFGAPVFQYKDITHNRFVHEFHYEAQVRLNFDPKLGMIIYDHLIQNPNTDRKSMVPDGSYEGFKFDNGLWVHQEKIFDQVSESPPIEVPTQEEKLRLSGEKPPIRYKTSGNQEN